MNHEEFEAYFVTRPKLDKFAEKFLRFMGLITIAVMVAFFLSGCDKEPPAQPVNIVAHDYCKIASKVSWSTRDTQKTIQSVRRENAKWDRRCLNRADS